MMLHPTQVLEPPANQGRFRCRSERDWKKPGDVVPRQSARFWIPLLALFTGARANEIAQLYVDNVVEEGGVVGLDIKIKHRDQRLKNRTAVRFIPLHPELIEIGFIDLVDQRRKEGSERVFQDLQKGSDGYYSSNLSRWFNERFLPSINAKSAKTSLHSFRHCYEDALKDAEVYPEWIDLLQGHKVPGMRGRYGSAGSAKKLFDQVSQVAYTGLDLHHLYPDTI